MIEAVGNGNAQRPGARSPGESGDTPGARALIRAVPAIADRLLAQHPGRVHREIVALVERALLSHVLDRLNGNQLRAARALGLNRNTLRKRCLALGLHPTAMNTRPAEKIS